MSRKTGMICPSALLLTLLPLPSAVSAGGPIGDRVLIYNDTTVNEALPALAYNSQNHNFLVVWQAESISTGAFEIWGRRVDSNGSSLSAALRISAPAQGEAPDVVYNSTSNEYLVVWQQGRAVMGQRVTASGALQGAAFTIAAGLAMPPTRYDQPAVTYASTSNRYLVVFRFHNELDGGSAIKARSYLADGAPEGASFDIVAHSNTTNPEQPDVAYNRSRNEALVVWQQFFPPSDLDLHARRVALTGAVAPLNSPFYISGEGFDELLPAVAAIPTVPDEGQYLVTYQVDPDSLNHDIHARIVLGIGALGGHQTLANTGWSEVRPAVTGCESNHRFFVTWVWIPVITPPAMMQVQARPLALDGTPLQPTQTIAGKQVFDAAVAAGNLCTQLVIYDDNDVIGTFNRGIYGQGWGERVYLPLLLRGL